MPTRRISLLRILAIVLGLVVSRGAFAQEPTPAPAVKSPTAFCWSETFGRGGGSVPTECATDYEKDAGLCYKKCPAGYKGVGPVCWQSCPDGWRDDGAFCAKPESYGRGAGYPWQFGDPLDDSGMKSRCERTHGAGNCEKDGAIFYPKCKAGFTKVGCCVCSPNCQSGMVDIGVSCTKKTSTRGGGTVPECASDKQYDAGLCYDYCGRGSDGVAAKGVGPMCWSEGPPGWVQCGAGWAKDQQACDTNIADQVLSVVDATLTTALLVGSMGASAAGKGTSVWSKAAWQSIKKIGKKNAKDALKEAVAANVVSGAADIGRDSASGAIDYIWELGELEDAQMTKVEKDHAIAQMSLNAITWIDPTGWAGVVAAYTKPICKDIAANKPPKKEPSGALHSLMQQPQAIEQPLKSQLDRTRQHYDALTTQVGKVDAAYKAAPPIAQPTLSAQLGALRARQAAAKNDLDRVSAAYQKFTSLKPKLAAYAPPVAAPRRTPIARRPRPID